MKLAISNIALSSFKHSNELRQLPKLGLSGLEVAPSRVWQDTWKGLSQGAVAKYRKIVEDAGLSVVGLHSLFYDRPDLGLFKDLDGRSASLDFLEHLSGVCRDLGGKTLIYGSGRNRGDLPFESARTEAIDFFCELTKRTEPHGTCFCFEPLGPKDTDFIHSALESLDIVNVVSSPALAVQLDAKALVENAEVDINVFSAVKDKLVHFHANEPGLGPLGSSGIINHFALGKMLNDVGYEGYVSIEQRMIDVADPLISIRESVKVLKECYT